jgi:uncharacterized membrane protein
MLPWLEARYLIPYAMLVLKWNLWQVFPIAIIGNFFPIPLILLFFKYVEKFLRKYKFWISDSSNNNNITNSCRSIYFPSIYYLA